MPLRFIAESADDELEWGCFLDWKVVDAVAGTLGTIQAVDDSTPNILFLVRDGERERIIPANEEWITGVDRNSRTIKYKLPQGLAEL